MVQKQTLALKDMIVPAQVTWLVPKRVILQRMPGAYTNEQAVAVFTEIRQHLDESEELLVHVLVDMTENTAMPMRLGEVHPIVKQIFSHPRLGWTVIYGMRNPAMRFLSGVVAQVSQVRFRNVASREQAIKHLELVVHDLPPLLPLLEEVSKAEQA